MGQSDKFGNIRVFGTLGWIAINWILSLYLRFWEGQETTLSEIDIPHLSCDPVFFHQ